ncbi:hypothetical protein VCRA2120O389_50022 [Vibrio crassostreae]|nr:hypothetical protein VCRA2113O359_50006 [Vibrio crassostreae]CAK2140143.1 hypothetical protein VCRA2113O354_50006 [Vibrio crassostreae]CAK2153958.1 hypothetical protein VCRA2115O371_60006 [Vibrio crassostreae]CAK2165822.1 hypothetical protein VCRA2113O362_50259 [Vibrio crassostreae]CAK2893129.1 hypothetical protein VCRA2117O375_30350 [Vibrio crassostreae]
MDLTRYDCNTEIDNPPPLWAPEVQVYCTQSMSYYRLSLISSQ